MGVVSFKRKTVAFAGNIIVILDGVFQSACFANDRDRAVIEII